MNSNNPNADVPYVPRTQLPKTGYTLMNDDGTEILANACPMHILVKSKWWIKFAEKVARGTVNISFFDEMARQHRDAKIRFGQGLYAVSVQTQYASLSLLENRPYILMCTDGKNKSSETTPVVIKSINMHKDNRIAWIWLE